MEAPAPAPAAAPATVTSFVAKTFDGTSCMNRGYVRRMARMRCSIYQLKLEIPLPFRAKYGEHSAVTIINVVSFRRRNVQMKRRTTHNRPFIRCRMVLLAWLPRFDFDVRATGYCEQRSDCMAFDMIWLVVTSTRRHIHHTHLNFRSGKYTCRRRSFSPSFACSLIYCVLIPYSLSMEEPVDDDDVAAIATAVAAIDVGRSRRT